MGHPTAEAPGITCDTPQGWVRGKAGGMRKASFTVQDGDRKVEVTAIDLLVGPGGATGAGALLPNVNRWRGQIKLPATTQAELDKLVRRIPIADVEGSYVELLGPEGEKPRQAILVVLALREGKAWFFKLLGDADLALREKTHFEEFVKSVRFETPGSVGAAPATPPATTPPATMPPATTPPAEPVTPPAGSGGKSPTLQYETPQGWTPGEAQGAAKAAFQVADKDRKAEVTVMQLPGRVEPLLPNVNRWRKQVKLGEITKAELEKILQPIQADGVEAQYLELVGPEDAKPREAMLVVLAAHDGNSWLFRLQGDAELALREKERFQGFVKSVKLSKADKGKNGE
jgi:hypothetical protein